MRIGAWGRLAGAAAIAAVAVGTYLTISTAPGASVKSYVTWEGIGPDKWASVWLIRRHIDPSAEIVFAEQGSTPTDGIAFDIPGSDYMRDGPLTTFETLLQSELGRHLRDDPALLRMAALVNEIEVSRWNIVSTSDAGLVEDGFRNLQFRYDRETVPFACYMAFFDSLQRMADSTPLDPSIVDTGDRLCDFLPETAKNSVDDVQEMPVRDVLSVLQQGAKVVFVDTRERPEYDEFHIPGAVHMPLRNVSADRMSEFADADLVIPYCVKDFRGYEVARAMSSLGVNNVAILNPYGIRGWRSTGLPVSGSRSLSEAEGQSALTACADDPEGCL